MTASFRFTDPPDEKFNNSIRLVDVKLSGEDIMSEAEMNMEQIDQTVQEINTYSE